MKSRNQQPINDPQRPFIRDHTNRYSSDPKYQPLNFQQINDYDTKKQQFNSFTKRNIDIQQNHLRNSSYKSIGKQVKQKKYSNSKNQEQKTSKPFYFKRAVFVIMLLTFMVIVCFYFNLLENYHFLSLFLGFSACIVFQLKLLQYIFKKEMYKMQIDEFGALRAKIKYLFGQLNPGYLDQKNRKKYYHHTLSQQDRLFSKQNSDIYNNTMQYLISKSKINHLQNINKINKKWQMIISKYEIMGRFVNSFMDVNTARSKVFTNFLDKINNSISDNQFLVWNKILKVVEVEKQQENKMNLQGIYRFFGTTGNGKNTKSIQKEKSQMVRQNSFTDFSLSQDGFSISQNNAAITADLKKQIQQLKPQSMINSRQQSQQKPILNWKYIITLLQYRNRTNLNKIKYMKKSILDQLTLNLQKVKHQKQLNLKQIQLLKLKYQSNLKSKQQIVNQINKLKQKIQELSKKIQNINRTAQNHQEICKMELEIRIKKVEIENLQVKVNLHDDLSKKNSYELYKKLREIHKELEIRVLPQFNNKLSNYINMLLEYEKKYLKSIFLSINQFVGIKKHSQKAMALSMANFFQQQLKNLCKLRNIQLTDNLYTSQIQFIDLLQIYKKKQKHQSTIKLFFQDIKKFYLQLSSNIQKSILIIQNYQKQLFQKMNSQQHSKNDKKKIIFQNKNKQNQFQSLSSLTSNYTTNLFYDRYFLNILGSLTRKDEKIFHFSLKLLEKQNKFVGEYFEKCCNPSVGVMQGMLERYKRVEEEVKKLEKNRTKNINLDQYQIRMNQLEHKKNQLGGELFNQLNKKQKYFIPSVINELTNQLFQKHQKIYQYILLHQKKSFIFQPLTQKQEQQLQRNIKFKQYQLYVLKVQKSNFDDPIYESIAKNIQNNRQENKKKLVMNDNLYKHGSFLNTNQRHGQGQNNNVNNGSKQKDGAGKEKHIETKQDSLKMLNRLLGVLFQQWSNSEFFHDLIKQELELSLNFKRPGVVQYIGIQHLKVEQKTKESGFQDIIPHASQIYRCLFDVKINFKGKIAVHVKTRLNFGNRTPININLLITQFVCPLRICFNPFTIGKSYVSLLQRPHLSIQYDVKIGQWHINKIPFFSQILKIFIVLKLRKKMLWPKKITLSVPLAYKNPIIIAIQERILFQDQKIKRKKN